MDDTKATREMAAMTREERLGTDDPDQNEDLNDREEAKEEEYDYFLDHI